MENLQTAAEQKLNAIMKYAPIGLSEITEDGSIVNLNIKGNELLQPIMGALGQGAENIFPLLQYIQPALAERIKTFSAPGGIILINEVFHFTLPGEAQPDRYFNFTSTKMFPGCIIVSFEDYTEKLQKEGAMRQAQVDKAVEQGKFEIASGVLHDIGNAVVGFGSHLTKMRRLQEQGQVQNLANLANFLTQQKKAIATAIGEQKAEALATMLNGIVQAEKNNYEEIKKSVTDQLRIISHIQEILNIQRQYVTGKETQERKPVNLRSVVNDCLSMLLASFDKRAIEVNVSLPTDLPIIKGDRTKLMQVILNLLKNAVEAIEINSPVKTIQVTLTATPGLLLFEVKDSGSGFDEETGKQLFERGFTTKSSGSGIGLSNCRQILESHGATLAVQSEGIGKGCTSTISFQL